MGFGRYDMLINCENKRQLELKESQLQWHEQNSDRSCSNRVILVILHMQLPQIWVTVMLERNVLQVYPASDRVVGSLHMAHTERRDAPGLPDFSLLKRLARDQLIFLLEQVTWPSTVSLNSLFLLQKGLCILNLYCKCQHACFAVAREEGFIYWCRFDEPSRSNSKCHNPEGMESCNTF